MEKAFAKKEQQDDQKLLPWMPYIFGFIFLLGFLGLYVLFSEKGTPAEESARTLAAQPAVTGPVEGLLNDIKTHQLKAAYGKTSSDFKISMPYEEFYSFINSYDSLNEWTKVTFSEPHMTSTFASVVANLHFNEEEEITLPITFTLIREEGAWKVYSFILNSKESNIPLQEMEKLQGVIHAINQELSYLKKENTMGAYYKMTTKGFQRETPYETFVEFVDNNPILSQQTGATFHEGTTLPNEGTLRVTLHTEEQSIPIDFTLAKEEGQWKIDKMELLLPAQLQKPLDQKQIDDSMEVITLFLNTLHENLFEKAYTLFTSAGFQKATSQPVFETFIEDHPILTEKEIPKFLDGGKMGDGRLIYLLYGKPPFRSAFEMRLVEEAGGWKIQGISVEVPQADTYAEPLDQEQALDLVQALLNLLGNNQIEQFYTHVASAAFKKSTSIDEFAAYLQKHPVLKNNPKVFLEEMLQDRDRLYVETQLIDETHTYSALFVFTYDEGGWKVLRLETKAERQIAEVTGAPSLELSKLLVGQKVDDQGMVEDAGTPLQKANDPIFLNVLLVSSLPGTEVDVEIRHQESQTKTFPVAGKVEDEGNNILTFVFNPPQGGWPAGHYRAIATSKGTQILEAPFLIEAKEEAPVEEEAPN